MYLTDEKRDIIKRVLTVKDYAIVAQKSGFSLSTVNNVIGQTLQITERNKAVHTQLIKLAKKRIDEITKLKAKL